MVGVGKEQPPAALDWEDWLDDECVDMDFVEDIELQHTQQEVVPATTGLPDAAVDDNGIAMLNCCGHPSPCNETLGRGSLLGRGCLTALMQGRNACSWLQQLPESGGQHGSGTVAGCVIPQVPIVFYAPCTPDMLLYNRSHFFNAVRQSLNTLEQLCSKTHQLSTPLHRDSSVGSPLHLRREVVTFYNCLWGFVHRHLCCSIDGGDQGEVSSFCSDVVADVLDILQYVGPLHALQSHVTAAVSPQGNECPSVAYHLFHLHLDIRWWSVAILHTVETTHGVVRLPPHHPFSRNSLIVVEPVIGRAGGGDEYSGAGEHVHCSGGDRHSEPFSQGLHFIFWDLFTLLGRETAKMCMDSAGVPCSCSAELAITVLHVAQFRSAAGRGQSCWEIVRSKFLMLLSCRDYSKGVDGVRSVTLREQPSSFILSCDASSSYPPPELRGLGVPALLEVLLAVARLQCYDEHGSAVPDADPQITPEPRLLRELILALLGDRTTVLRWTSTSQHPSPHSSSCGSNSSSSSGNSSSSSGNNNKVVPDEACLRRGLRAVLLVLVCWRQHWSPRLLECATLLWERCYARALDTHFLLSGPAAVQGLACVSASIKAWVSAAHQRCLQPADAALQESSWLLFLRILGVVVQGGGVKALVGVKGRVLSKFSPRRLSELSSAGLYNTATLLLTLTTAGGGRDMAIKASELLCTAVSPSPVPPSVMSSVAPRMSVSVRGTLALALVLAQEGGEVTPVLSPLLRLVGCLAQQGTGRDVLQQREASRVLQVYLVSAADVCRHSPDLALGQHHLYGPWLRSFLFSCSASEGQLSEALHSLRAALHRLLEDASRHSRDGSACLLTGHELVASIDRAVHHLFRSQCAGLAPPSELASVAASLTVAHAALAAFTSRHSTVLSPVTWDESVDRSTNIGNVFQRKLVDKLNNGIVCVDQLESNTDKVAGVYTTAEASLAGDEYRVNHKEAWMSLMSYILTNDCVNPQFVLQYISELLPDTAVTASRARHSLNSEEDEAPPCPLSLLSTPVPLTQQHQLFSRYVQCCLLQGPDEPLTLALVPRIFGGEANVGGGLEDVRGFLACPPACPYAAIVALVRAMAREHQTSGVQVQSRCLSLLSGVERAVQQLLQLTPPPPHLGKTMNLVADMIRNAPALLYVKSKGSNSLLPALVTCLVLSKSSYVLDRPLPPYLNMTLSAVLQQVLLGLSSLPLESDPFLTRTTRTVITNYLHRYPVQRPPAPRHPFVTLLTRASSGASSSRLRAVFLDVLQTDFFGGRKWEGERSRLHAALQLLQQVLSIMAAPDPRTNSDSSLCLSWSSAAIPSLLPLLLKLLLYSEDRTTNRCVTDLLKTMFAMAEQCGNPTRLQLVGAVLQLCQQELAWQSARVFLMLRGVCALRPHVVHDALPALWEELTRTEHKRGTGQDQRLRQQYESLVQHTEACIAAAVTKSES